MDDQSSNARETPKGLMFRRFRVALRRLNVPGFAKLEKKFPDSCQSMRAGASFRLCVNEAFGLPSLEPKIDIRKARKNLQGFLVAHR